MQGEVNYELSTEEKRTDSNQSASCWFKPDFIIKDSRLGYAKVVR